MNESLIDGDELKQQLENLLPHAKESIIFISAYITESGINWLAFHASKCSIVHVICRLAPSDVMSGSTHLTALETALNKGMRVSCLHSLHAKIYSIDYNYIFVGSANLTNHGLKIYSIGNLEACTTVPANNLNCNFISTILKSSTALDLEVIKNMQSYIDRKEASLQYGSWPEGILKNDEGIWVRDFFWSRPRENEQSIEKIHDLELLGISVDSEVTADYLMNARCVRWLLRKLENELGNELYFGTLTKILHDELKDDPAPYRKDIKSLIQNLLEYVDLYLGDVIEISRPKHSQRIKLLVTG